MRIELRKFGTLLMSRRLGKEAVAAFAPTLNSLPENVDKIEVDFDGVITFSPSWGDEFLTPLIKKYGDRVVFFNTDNPSVKATLEILEKIRNA